LYATDVPAHASARFEAAAGRPVYSPPRAEGLTVVPANPRGQKDSFGTRFNGKVRNHGSSPAQFIKVRVSGFDSADKLVGVGETYARGKEGLAPGHSAPWSLSVAFVAAPERVEVAAHGRPVK